MFHQKVSASHNNSSGIPGLQWLHGLPQPWWPGGLPGRPCGGTALAGWLHRHPSKSSSPSWAPQPSTPLSCPSLLLIWLWKERKRGLRVDLGGVHVHWLGLPPAREIQALFFCHCPFRSFCGLCQLVGDTMSHSGLMRPARPGECH